MLTWHNFWFGYSKTNFQEKWRKYDQTGLVQSKSLKSKQVTRAKWVLAKEDFLSKDIDSLLYFNVLKLIKSKFLAN